LGDDLKVNKNLELSDAMDPEMKRIHDRLWNVAVSAASYEGAGEKYQAAILEQYKIYVEMADRISQRRGLTNTFFLTLNSAVFTVIGVFWKDRPIGSAWLLALPLVIALGQCTAWWWLVRSYRLLNGAKYKVIGALEQRLPAALYWQAEWVALGEGKNWRKYLPLTHLEQWIPVLFGLVYLVGFIVAVAA
jgi:hypothetical protein